MRVLKSLLNFYINSSIHVSIAVVALSYITCLELDLNCDKNLLLALFYASICGYNFVKYFGLVKFYHRRLASWLKSIQILTFLCLIAMIYYGINLDNNALLLAFSMALVTFLYAIPVFPKVVLRKSQKNLRHVSGLKIYVIAFVWSVVTVFIPVLNSSEIISWDVSIIALQRFLIVVVLMLPFEIRDLNYDTLKLATVPQKIGVRATKALGLLLLIIVFLLEFLKDEVNTNQLWSLMILVAITALFILFSRKQQSKYYSAFWVEALPILWAAVLVILS
ncbi:MAG: hypothetical protein HKP28_11175 [Winogradskyella sp.]|nr:hypothetical protein [Winogradskyella sp.]